MERRKRGVTQRKVHQGSDEPLAQRARCAEGLAVERGGKALIGREIELRIALSKDEANGVAKTLQRSRRDLAGEGPPGILRGAPAPDRARAPALLLERGRVRADAEPLAEKLDLIGTGAKEFKDSTVFAVAGLEGAGEEHRGERERRDALCPAGQLHVAEKPLQRGELAARAGGDALGLGLRHAGALQGLGEPQVGRGRKAEDLERRRGQGSLEREHDRPDRNRGLLEGGDRDQRLGVVCAEVLAERRLGAGNDRAGPDLLALGGRVEGQRCGGEHGGLFPRVSVHPQRLAALPIQSTGSRPGTHALDEALPLAPEEGDPARQGRPGAAAPGVEEGVEVLEVVDRAADLRGEPAGHCGRAREPGGEVFGVEQADLSPDTLGVLLREPAFLVGDAVGRDGDVRGLAGDDSPRVGRALVEVSVELVLSSSTVSSQTERPAGQNAASP